VSALVLYALFRSPTSDPASPDELVILAYSSFLHSWGAGPALTEEFKKISDVPIRWVDGGDSAKMIDRLRLQTDRQRVDLILGLDQLSLPEARQLGGFRSLAEPKVKWHPRLPREALAENFIPFDWAPLSLVYRELSNTPKQELPLKLDDLLAADYRASIALEDPRTSTPGFQFLYWILKLKGDEAGFLFLRSLMPQIKAIFPSWSLAYSFFKRGETRFVFSYVTSPIYHQLEENDDSYRFLVFQEGHPYQVEYAAVPEKCLQCRAAEQFIELMLGPTAQELIMKKNYMLPVIEGVAQGPFDFTLPPLLSLGDRRLSISQKREILSQWKKIAP
jgi:thiamine transport system substrate-binding protein